MCLLSMRVNNVLADQAHPPFSQQQDTWRPCQKRPRSHCFCGPCFGGTCETAARSVFRPSVRQSHIFIVRRRTNVPRFARRTEKHFLIWGDRRTRTAVRREGGSIFLGGILFRRCHHLRTGEQFAEGKLFWRRKQMTVWKKKLLHETNPLSQDLRT